MTGVINIYKEKGYTSHDVVAIVRKMLGKAYNSKIKTGHTGTLDPQAEGVLPICVGRATKLAGYLTATDKSYQAELILGMTTDTYDVTGQILTTAPVDADFLKSAAIKEAVDFFIGGYEQTPPMYSALKVNGKKLYELARAGKSIEVNSRWVDIKDINIIKDKAAINKNSIAINKNSIWLNIDCGKGTYIRSLCADIGSKLGCGGCMGNLIRTKTGTFTIDKSMRLSELSGNFITSDFLTSDFLTSSEQALPAPKGTLIGPSKKAINGHPVPLSQVNFNKNEPTEGALCWLYGNFDFNSDPNPDSNSDFNSDPNSDSNSDSNPDFLCPYDSNKVLIGLYTKKNGMLRPEVMMYENH